MPSRSRRAARDLCLMVALVVACLALFTSVAFAAPSDPVMGIAELEAKLAASPTGTLQGYLKTVCRGFAIEKIPVEVQATTLGQQMGPDSMSTLILFEASGPQIDKYGGIVQGMSGSPVYVDDGGTDKLVGALSYGDYFTLGGTGLATPIEGMAKLEDDYAQPLLAPLSKPVMTEDGLKTRVLVSPDPSGIPQAEADGTLVAKPLASVFVGGIAQSSNAFKLLSARLETKGFNLVPMGIPTPTKSEFTTDFAGGSAVAGLAATGDLMYGGVGTTTYSNGNNVVAFGHPLFWEGETSLYLANAWVDGIWPSAYAPYKLASVGKTRGELTQDRGAGILGTISRTPTETVVTATAENVDDGTVASSTAHVSRHVMGSTRFEYEPIPMYAGYVAASRVLDVYMPDGSACTTTTVKVVGDGGDFEIVRVNRFDTARDIGLAVTSDIGTIVNELRAVNNNGLGHAEIVSVDVQSSISRKHNKAQIVDIEAPNGLKVGTNLVRVSLLKYGDPETQTVDVMLPIAAGTSLAGRLTATCADPYGIGAMGYSDDGQSFDFSTADRRLLPEAIEDLAAEPTNDMLQLEYVVGDAMPPDFQGDPADIPVAAKASAKVAEYLTGTVTKSTSAIDVELSATTLPYNGTLFVAGFVDGAESGTVKVYRKYNDETGETLVATAPIQSVQGDTFFEATISGSKKNFTLRFHFDGDSDTLASEAKASVKVAARVSLSASPASARYGTYVTLKAAIAPTMVTGNVVFQKLVSGRWVNLTTKPVSAGVASYKFKPAKGTTTYRARYLGGPTNVAAYSGSVRVVRR